MPAGDTFTIEGDMEKITLRIPAELKELATEAAGKASLSTNSWYVRMLARALRGAAQAAAEHSAEKSGEHWQGRHKGRRGPGGRLSGWVGDE